MIALACILLSTVSDAAWLLRAGFDADPGTSHSTVVHAYMYSAGQVPADPSALPIAAATLKWNGDPAGALLQWRTGGADVPATRNDLLGAYVWFGRAELDEYIGLGYTPPPDMVDSRYPTHSEAVMRLGWMARMPDGLFHPEFPVGATDLRLLNVPASDHIGVSRLDSAVEALFQ